MAPRRPLDRLARGESEFFAFEVHFAHVLDQGGFDVVAGNPPWVRSSRIDASTRRQLKERYETFGASGGLDQSDLSLAFVEKAASLAREEGFIARFSREIQAMKQLTNPHVVKLFESGTDGETYYILVGGYEGEQGNYTLSLTSLSSCPIPASATARPDIAGLNAPFSISEFPIGNKPTLGNLGFEGSSSGGRARGAGSGAPPSMD